jgi:hypothetical protein
VGVGPKIGPSRRSSSIYDSAPYTPPNPNPDKYRILDYQEFTTGYTVIKLKYEGCTNYEGTKILVFKCPMKDLILQRTIDPHFCDSKTKKHPIARFIPTQEGWNMAIKFVSNVQTH